MESVADFIWNTHSVIVKHASLLKGGKTTSITPYALSGAYFVSHIGKLLMGTDAYLQARAACVEKEREIEAVVDGFQELVRTLGGKRWKRMMFSNTDATFPMEISLSGGSSINTDHEFPSLKQIAKFVSEWHKLRKEAQNLWGKLPQEIQEGVVDPPS